MHKVSRIVLGALLVMLVVVAPAPALAYQQEGASGSWVQSGGDWWYRYDDGTYPRADAAGTYELVEISGAGYAFDSAGWMATGWIADGGAWLYTDPSGRLAADGWALVGGSWYLFDGGGRMLTGWQQVGGSWYYLDASGAMRTGWQLLGGSWYYLDGSGLMLTGWQNVGGTWYYMDASGAMQTGWQAIGGQWYYFDVSGAMSSSRWEGNYYLTASGAMAVNTWIGSYYVGSDGAWIPGYGQSELLYVYHVPGSEVYHTHWCRTMGSLSGGYNTFHSIQEALNDGARRLCKNCAQIG